MPCFFKMVTIFFCPFSIFVKYRGVSVVSISLGDSDWFGDVKVLLIFCYNSNFLNIHPLFSEGVDELFAGRKMAANRISWSTGAVPTFRTFYRWGWPLYINFLYDSLNCSSISNHIFFRTSRLLILIKKIYIHIYIEIKKFYFLKK